MNQSASTNNNGTAIAQRPIDIAGLEVAASSRNPREITKRIREAMETAFLISPMTQCPTLPEGCEVAFSTVMADTDIEHKEIYPIAGGQFGLHKVVLNRIKIAIGVDWDRDASGRLDDGSNAHFCHYKAFGYVRKFDGTFDTIEGDEAIDLRAGSALCDEIRMTKIEKYLAKAEKDAKRELKPAERQQVIRDAELAADSDIRKKRIKILRLTQTSAQNAAIRTLGIKTSYTKEELEDKPFVIASLIFTGRSDNPVLADRFATMIAEKFLNGRERLYGSPSRPQLRAGSPPPPVETSINATDHPDLLGVIDAEDDDDDDENQTGATNGSTATSAATAQQTTAATSSTAAATGSEGELFAQQTEQGEATKAAETKNAGAVEVSEPAADFKIPFGRTKDKMLSEVSMSELSSLHSFYTSSIESDDPGKQRYRQKNIDARQIIEQWIEYRRATGGTKAKTPKIY
jgi:hypothetical protein